MTRGGPVGGDAPSVIPAELLALIDNTLEFVYHDGGVTPLPDGSDTGWRTLPYLMVSACDCAGTLELEDRVYTGTGSPLSGACVPAGLHHRCASRADSPGTSWWSCVSYTILHGLDLFTLLQPSLLLDEGSALRIREINTELARVGKIASPTLAELSRKRVLGYELLAVIAARAQWREPNEQAAGAIHRLVPLFPFLQENLHRRITVNEMARRCKLSATSFHLLFRRCTGMSPHAYVQQRRLRKAQRLLITTSSPIADIALAVGQVDQFFFSRLFRKKCGLSPTEYRRQLSRRMM